MNSHEIQAYSCLIVITSDLHCCESARPSYYPTPHRLPFPKTHKLPDPFLNTSLNPPRKPLSIRPPKRVNSIAKSPENCKLFNLGTGRDSGSVSVDVRINRNALRINSVSTSSEQNTLKNVFTENFLGGGSATTPVKGLHDTFQNSEFPTRIQKGSSQCSGLMWGWKWTLP